MAININMDAIKKIAGNVANKAGDGFNKVMQSGFKPEGSIFDAASKLGINNTDDLKSMFAKVKENPTETIGNALNTLHDSGFRLGQTNANRQANNTNATNANAPVNQTQTAQRTETPQIEDSTNQAVPEDNNDMKSIQDALKRAGLDLNDRDVQQNINKFIDNPDEIKKFIAQKMGIGGEAAGGMQLEG